MHCCQAPGLSEPKVQVSQIKNSKTHSDTTGRENVPAFDVSIASATWVRVARAECQVQLLKDLQKAKVGVAEVEKFLESLEDAKKSKKNVKKKKNKEKRDTGILKVIMDSKVRDAEDDLKEKETRKKRLKRKLEEMHGKNSKSARKK